MLTLLYAFVQYPPSSTTELMCRDFAALQFCTTEQVELMVCTSDLSGCTCMRQQCELVAYTPLFFGFEM